MLEQTRETINDATIPTPELEPITANERRDKGICTTSGVAYLELFLNGNPRRAIIDSGSQLSLVPENLISKRLIRPCKQKLVAVNGTEVKISGQTLLQCRLEEYGFEVPCVISPDIKETIFGLPWLLAQDVQWNVKAGHICLKGHWFPMQHTDRELSCRRVIVEESMTTFLNGRQPTLSETVKWTTSQKALASIELETKGSVNNRTPNRVRVKRKSRPRRSRSRYRVTGAAGASAAIQHKAAAAKGDHVRQLPNESDAPQSAATSCVERSLCGQRVTRAPNQETIAMDIPGDAAED